MDTIAHDLPREHTYGDDSLKSPVQNIFYNRSQDQNLDVPKLTSGIMKIKLKHLKKVATNKEDSSRTSDSKEAKVSPMILSRSDSPGLQKRLKKNKSSHHDSIT